MTSGDLLPLRNPQSIAMTVPLCSMAVLVASSFPHPFICVSPPPTLPLPSSPLQKSRGVALAGQLKNKTKRKKKTNQLKFLVKSVQNNRFLATQANKLSTLIKRKKNINQEVESPEFNGTIWAVLGKALLSLPCLRLHPLRLLVPT